MPEFVTITSERLDYRPLREEDMETYVRLRNEASYRRWFYFQDPPTLASAAREIREMQEKSKRRIDLLREAFDSGLYLKATGELIGTVSLNKFHGPEEELEHVEIGYGIGEAYQCRGYATEAAGAAVRWGLLRLRELGAEPVITGCAEHENWASRKVLEKTGFSFVCAKQYVSMYIITGA
ncbi:GNAT family N-acetyltransferase ['Paenibacillus yunnanensis' Narsing Rao et al. 2020]|uniref:GNAT family N-acetyltransferase n=1 Tax=Paenibacillus tengchongensis TaxID=2608684 RepID=UPI00124F36EB|nr:GNAT family N-acetyltransferase [Paenibacillus tengchongensis]